MTTDQISLIKLDVDPIADADIIGDDSTDEPAPAQATKARRFTPRTWLGALALGRTGRSVLIGLTVAAVALATALYFLQFRPEAQTNGAARGDVLRAASEGTIAVLSYSPENLDAAFATAKSHLTGDFLTKYTDFAQQVVAPAARDRAVTTSASVVQSAITDMQPDSATVLMYVNQQTMSKDRTEPSLLASTVLVTMTEVDGQWLIAEFNPI